MSYNFREYDQDQLLLMPPSIQEWVKEDSFARFLSEIIEGMDARGRLDAFYAPYRVDGWGAAAFHPVMLLKVLLYAYTNGVTSSRRIEAMLEVDIAFRYLAANNQPDFRTINGFRTTHLEALLEVFVDVLELCRDAGMVKLGRVALDGHRVAGDASLSENRKRERLEQQVQELLDEAALIDARENQQHGPEARGDELPSGLKNPRKRAEHLQRALDELQKREAALRKEQEERIAVREKEEQEAGRKKPGRKPKPAAEVKLPEEARVNRTDPESRVMKGRNGRYLQGYNGQAMVECGSQIIVAQQLTNEEADVNLLAPMLERCEEQAGARPEQVLADAGYWSEANGELDGQGGTDLLIATVHWARENPDQHPQRDRMEAKLEKEEGKAAYAQRGSTAEPVFGQMVTRGLERFRLRGKKKAGLEWSLWCTTHNLLKLWRHGRSSHGRSAPCTAALAA
ncbi:MAG TPA: IS1182 family transposase [Candidatus Limnocylindria bacterium]|nr:IS1182 family transposase [Candidatus Limnocylindria bacterium]